MSARIAIAATSRLAVDAGLRVAQAGGSALDAAIAATITATVTEPGIVSLLGGAYLTFWPAGGEPEVIDGNVEMPGRGLPPDRFGSGVRQIETSYGGGVTLFAGHGSVATPGTLAALSLAHRRHGRLPWRELVAPAIEAADSGFPLGASAASYLALTHDSVFGWDEQTAALVHRPDGSVVGAGDRLRDPALATTLRTIAEHGARAAYTGDLGAALAADMADRGGLVTAADLAAYRPTLRTALRTELAGWQLATNPPPSIGGPVLTVMLRELARHRPPSWHDVVAVQRQVLGYRVHVHDHSRDLEEDGYALLEQVERHGLASLPTSSSTINVSVVDDEGNAVAVTASSGYGSGVTVPGTGLMLNNCLGEPELNRLGLHALAPGTRLASNMAPTAGRHPDGRWLAIGSPGADRITTALAQVLVRYCLLGRDLQESIDQPRLHLTVRPDGSSRLELEQDEELHQVAAQSGLPVVDHGARSMFFGGVGAAVGSTDGTLTAAADLRREAATAVSDRSGQPG